MNSSTNASSTPPSIYVISTTVLNAQLNAMIIWMVVCTLGVITGLLQIAITLFSKPLRKMDQSLIFALALADCLKTAGYGSFAIRRIYLVVTGGNDVQRQRTCMVWLFFTIFPLYTAFLLIIMLSLDRLCALAFPIWYKGRTARFRMGQILVSCLLGCSIGATIFVGVSPDMLVPVCTYGTSPTEAFLHFAKYFENVVVFSTLGINAVSCAILLRKWLKARRSTQTLTAFKKNVPLNALKMLSSVVLVYLISTTAASVTLNVFNSSGWSDVTRMTYAPVSGLFEIVRGCLDFPLYVILIKKYRSGFREVVLKRICCCFVGNAGSGSDAVVSSPAKGNQNEVGRMNKVAACGMMGIPVQ